MKISRILIVKCPSVFMHLYIRLLENENPPMTTLSTTDLGNNTFEIEFRCQTNEKSIRRWAPRHINSFIIEYS